MRVLLTGATGLIGSAILGRILGDGHDVVAVAHRSPARPVRHLGSGSLRMQDTGAADWSGPSVVARAAADILIGLGIAFRRSAKIALLAAMGLTLFYMVAGSLLLPRRWIDPLGPLWKNWPVLILNFIALAMLAER